MMRLRLGKDWFDSQRRWAFRSPQLSERKLGDEFSREARKSQMNEAPAVHATLVCERSIPATTEQVFSAYADIAERQKWGVPSEKTALIYDKADFREGGED